uniref:Metallothionein-like protein n=1 Tax=Ipomoea batatas TaxID=4120 RepID=Q9SPE7_IPOBA|nr:metallothionein-like protein [Ipomoea batatas]
MSCCGGNCGCGSACKCGGGCGGCGMFPDVENVKTVTLIQGVAPVNNNTFEGAEMGAGGGDGCKCGSGSCSCGPACNCDPCKC